MQLQLVRMRFHFDLMRILFTASLTVPLSHLVLFWPEPMLL